MKVYNVYKPLGKTPLQALENLRKKVNINPSIPLTYAGRLDPMAEGVLLILAGATQEQKNKYQSLPKIYEAEVLFGFSTDSFDALGLAKKLKCPTPDKKLILRILKKYQGKIKLPLPVYSSPPVKGKPLHMWAREGRAEEIDIPLREMEIKSIKFLGIKKYSSNVLMKKIESKIKKVDGDFRQQKIIKKWQALLAYKTGNYFALKIYVKCGSGTYIRSLANELGKNFQTGSSLLSLKRLSVGRYKAAN